MKSKETAQHASHDTVQKISICVEVESCTEFTPVGWGYFLKVAGTDVNHKSPWSIKDSVSIIDRRLCSGTSERKSLQRWLKM